MDQDKTYIIVGVEPGQPSAVVDTAARFAERFDAELVCALVDTSRYTVEERADGTVVSMPIDPDLADVGVGIFDPELLTAISEVMEDRPVRWSARVLAGGAAQELARLATELDAAMIVVGTREAGFKGIVHEFFTGSVAVELAHRQHRPVVVVPLNPVAHDGELPWQMDE